MRVPDDYRHCVTFLGTAKSPPSGAGDPHDANVVGTGFFLSQPSEFADERSHIYLVTAKHAAEQLETSEVSFARLNTHDGGSRLLILGPTPWWHHPDPAVDVSIAPILPNQGRYSFTHVPESMLLPEGTDAVGPGDSAFVVGMFVYVKGETRNLPIVRAGTIAMVPLEPIPTKLGNTDAYLLEARSMGGMSGSPVFVRLHATTKIALLGLWHGHWNVPGAAPVDAGVSIVVRRSASARLFICPRRSSTAKPQPRSGLRPPRERIHGSRTSPDERVKSFRAARHLRFAAGAR